MTPIALSSWSYPDQSCVITIAAAQYEYRFASQSDLAKVLAQFDFGPGKALAMAKRRAASWRKLEERESA